MWCQDIVDTLMALKAEGYDFEDAWCEAVELYPPRGRDLGPSVPSLLDEEEAPAVFLRRVCGEAWAGVRPVLRHLANAMELVEVVDEPQIVQSNGGRSHLATAHGD